MTSDERNVHTLSLQRDKEKKKSQGLLKNPPYYRARKRAWRMSMVPFPGCPHDERHKHIDHLFHDAFETALERTLMVRPDAERSRLSASRRGRKIEKWAMFRSWYELRNFKIPSLICGTAKTKSTTVLSLTFWHCHILNLLSYALGTAMLENTP